MPDRYYAPCPCCPSWFASDDGIMPMHTRSVRGIGWGGKPMHLRCPGTGRHVWSAIASPAQADATSKGGA